VTKKINDLIDEFQRKFLASKQDYFNKLKSFQKSQDIKTAMIIKCIEVNIFKIKLLQDVMIFLNYKLTIYNGSQNVFNTYKNCHN